jgi:DNA repair exonuclease SbcCD ATPase subunit
MATVAETDAITDLRQAVSAYERAVERVEELGEDDLERLSDAHERARRIVESYGERAVGTGDFEAYVRLQEEIAALVESMPDDRSGREHFEAIEETLDRRTLRQRDLETVREHLDRVQDLVERLEERETAASELLDARKRARRRIEELQERIEELQALQAIGDADLEAPVEELRQPIERYDDGITAAFDSARREESSRSVIDRVASAGAYPLVGFERPAEELETFLQDHPVGEEPVTTLLQYAEYSRSKLSHHVDDPARFKREIATQRTYLEELDAEPLTVGWPPPPAATLWWETRALRSVAARFADEETLAALREVRRLAKRDDYERIQTAATARVELRDDQRERLERGEVADELARRREEREAVASVLTDAPDP